VTDIHKISFFCTIQQLSPFLHIGLGPTIFHKGQQEAKLMLKNPLDAFRGQSRSPNTYSAVPYVRYGFL